jgi:hypothetical protein
MNEVNLALEMCVHLAGSIEVSIDNGNPEEAREVAHELQELLKAILVVRLPGPVPFVGRAR